MTIKVLLTANYRLLPNRKENADELLETGIIVSNCASTIQKLLFATVNALQRCTAGINA